VEKIFQKGGSSLKSSESLLREIRDLVVTYVTPAAAGDAP
jgi:hypothetical protein